MTGEEVKALLGTTIVLGFVYLIIKARYDYLRKVREEAKRKNIYNPDEYDR